MMLSEILLVFSFLLCSNCLIDAASLHFVDDGTPKYAIVDTDMGADDALALNMLLNANKQLKNINVLAITTTDGNTNEENVVKNTYRILDGLNRTDIPIYKGATEALIPLSTVRDNFYGKNGFSDIDIWLSHFPSDINSLVQTKSAIEIIRDLVMQYPNKISLICLGPLTNIALAIKAYPKIKENIKDVFIMGGNFQGRGNVVPGAEFNFYIDPEAAHIVLNSLKCPITIVPLESVGSTHISLDWRFNVLGKVNDGNMQLLNEADKITYQKGMKTIYEPFDAMLIAVYLFPEKSIKTMNTFHATVELQGTHTRGQMVLNHQNNNHNVLIIEELNEEAFKKILLSTASSDFDDEKYIFH